MKRAQDKPILPSTLTRAERTHISFLMRITGTATGMPGGKVYGDGGPGLHGRQARRRRGRAAKAARKRNRRR